MKLETVNVTNFRCFKDLKISLEHDVTLIVGVNGAGKTAILDAIAIALFDFVAASGGRSDQARKRQNAALKPTDIFIPSGEGQDSELRKDFVDIFSSASYPKSLSGITDPRRLEWNNHIIFTPPNSFRYSSANEAKLSALYAYAQSLWRIYREEPQALNSLTAVAYYRADRKLKEVPSLGDIFSVTFEREAAFEGALDAGADYQSMCQWLYLTENEELRLKRKDSSRVNMILDAIRAAVRLLAEGVEDFGFEGRPPRLVLEVTQNGVRRRQALEQLSDGYRNVIAICLDFARRLALANPYSDAPLAEPGILLIDEIELHLHVAWQHAVIPKLRLVFPNVQIIATTHSPQVLSTVETRCIRVLHNQTLHMASSGTLGAESKRILEEVLMEPSRPPEQYVEIVKSLRELFELINSGDLDAANAKVREFLDLGYESDPAIIDAEMTIENKLWERGNQQ